MDINKAFKQTCKILFKREIGELNEFEAYLRIYNEEVHKVKSASGTEVYYTAPYSQGARFLAYDTAFNRSMSKPLDINKIKDIDSLFETVQENVYYAGSKVLGNSHFVEESENVTDSSVVYRSSEILRCEYVAYSGLLRDSKYLFGCSCLDTASFCINLCEASASQRCFESNISFFSSDTYYVSNCKGCHDILFSFDQHAKRNMIGNNPLEKGQYLKIKDALIVQMADELEKKKRLPSLLDVILRGE